MAEIPSDFFRDAGFNVNPNRAGKLLSPRTHAMRLKTQPAFALQPELGGVRPEPIEKEIAAGREHKKPHEGA